MIGLQNQINSLKTAADRLGLQVNIQKTKVVIFRKGGHIAAHEHWIIDGKRLEIVNEYKYLGYLFTTRLSPNVPLVDFASRGKAGLIQICRSLNKLAYVVPDLFFKIFDCQIQPILLYASELWGLGKTSIIETVHLYGLKRFLNVSMKTPNIMVYGDTGRYPLSFNAAMRVAEYWIKIFSMVEERLPKRTYRMLVQNIESEYN